MVVLACCSRLQACPLLVARLSSNPEWLTAIVEKFVTLAKSSHYQERQCFVKICASFLPTPSQEQSQDDGKAQQDATLADAARDFFSSNLAAVFFTLALDPVSNVRIVFSEILVKYQQLCREHPECPDVLRKILTTEFASADNLAAVLSERVKSDAKRKRN